MDCRSIIDLRLRGLFMFETEITASIYRSEFDTDYIFFVFHVAFRETNNFLCCPLLLSSKDGFFDISSII